MKVILLATPELEATLGQLGLGDHLRILPIEALLSLSMSELSSGDPDQVTENAVRGFPAGVIVGDIDAATLERLKSVASALLPAFSTIPPVHQYRPGDESGLMSWVTGRLTGLSAAHAVEAGRAALQLGTMRIALEHSERAVRRLEKVLEVVLVTTGPVLNFQIPPNGDYVPLAGELRQPIDGVHDAIHGFDLMLRCRPGISNGIVRVELVGQQSGERVASWRVEEAQIRSGWNRFDCPSFERAMVEPVLIKVRGEQAERCEIGLGTATPEAPGVLALRVWGSLPAVDLPRSGIGHPAEGVLFARTGKVGTTLPLTDRLPFVEPAGPHDASLIKWRTEAGALEVHPQGAVPTLAVIARLPARRVRTLRAKVRLGHPEAQPADFALWAGIAGEAYPFAPAKEATRPRGFGLIRGREASEPAGSAADAKVDWLSLLADEEGEVVFRFPEPVTGEIDIVLATRNPTPDSRYSWALFRSLVAEIEPEHGAGALA
ncbi:DUF6212 domain-containing protein [Bosea sp. 117]|uniref:DUF6212 domain-containing protein n=1 Tax=Bosea sp. 117 TaxID=1125973 RepID=UPI000493D0FC|nr:DUF6212 domain-containing protein [Bosea sp. 117]